MNRIGRIFQPDYTTPRRFTWGDFLALLIIVVLLYVGVRLSFSAPDVIRGPEISLAPGALPWNLSFLPSRLKASLIRQ